MLCVFNCSLTIQQPDGELVAFIVAPDEGRAKAFADTPPGDVTLRLDWIDENLPEDCQLGNAGCGPEPCVQDVQLRFGSATVS